MRSPSQKSFVKVFDAGRIAINVIVNKPATPPARKGYAPQGGCFVFLGAFPGMKFTKQALPLPAQVAKFKARGFHASTLLALREHIHEGVRDTIHVDPSQSSRHGERPLAIGFRDSE